MVRCERPAHQIEVDPSDAVPREDSPQYPAERIGFDLHGGLGYLGSAVGDARSSGLPETVSMAATAVVSVVTLATAGAGPSGNWASTETSGADKRAASLATIRNGGVMPFTEISTRFARWPTR